MVIVAECSSIYCDIGYIALLEDVLSELEELKLYDWERIVISELVGSKVLPDVIIQHIKSANVLKGNIIKGNIKCMQYQ